MIACVCARVRVCVHVPMQARVRACVTWVTAKFRLAAAM